MEAVPHEDEAAEGKMGPAGGLGGWGSPAAHTWPHVAGCALHWFPWAERLAKLLLVPESLGHRDVS